MALHALGVTAAVTATTTTETVVGVIGPLPEDVGTGAETAIWLQAELAVTTGAAATGVTIRFRKGNGITGAIVGVGSGVIVTAASTVVGLSWAAVDTATGDATPEQEYSCTIQQASATGNASVVGVITAQPGVLTT